MHDNFIEVLTEYCERVFEAVKGEHPIFMVAYWEDQVALARVAPEAPGSTEVLQMEGQYRASRNALATFYKDSIAAITAAADEPSLMAVGSALIQGAHVLVLSVTEDGSDTRNNLLSELGELQNTLEELVS